jgi:hypothetical protein
MTGETMWWPDGYAGGVEYVRADARTGGRVMDWQPIETAPRNPAGEVSGPPILLWNEYNRKIYHGFWTTCISNERLTTGWAIWSSVDVKHPIDFQKRITHWMPPPEPPAEKE